MITFINEKHNSKAVVRAKIGDKLTKRQIRRCANTLCPERRTHEIKCECSPFKGKVYGGDLMIDRNNIVIERNNKTFSHSEFIIEHDCADHHNKPCSSGTAGNV